MFAGSRNGISWSAELKCLFGPLFLCSFMWLPLTAKSCKNLLREVLLCRALCILAKPRALLMVWVWAWQIMGQPGTNSFLRELSGVSFEQEKALDVYGPVTSVVGAEHLQSPECVPW